jgi:hypothetical protein
VIEHRRVSILVGRVGPLAANRRASRPGPTRLLPVMLIPHDRADLRLG